MHIRSRVTMGALCLGTAAGPALGQVFLHWLGPAIPENDVSALSRDGSAAVVSGKRWSISTGMQQMPTPPEPNLFQQAVAEGISGDGDVFVGSYSTQTERVRFHWRDGVYRDLYRVNWQSYPPTFPLVRAVSTDGTRVLMEQPSLAKAPPSVYVWREAGSTVGVWTGGIGYQTYALTATPDFSAIIVSVPGGCRTMLNLSTFTTNFAPALIPEQNWTVRVQATNADASLMVGMANSPPIPFRWDNHVPSEITLVGTPLAVADDGSAIVTDQWVWTPGNPTVSHRSYLVSRGARLLSGPVAISRVSSDLSAFAGVAPSPTGPGQQRFIIQFRTSGCDSIDFNNDGLLPDVLDIQQFLRAFSGQFCGASTCNDIDFNNDGLFPDVADIDSFLRLFSGGAC